MGDGKEEEASDRSVGSDRSVRSNWVRPSGGYRNLRSFQAATVIYDATVSFCDRFLNPRSRLVDQMVQAARSGRQNIAEGSRASATSSQTELRLVNVARASLDELLLDYEDYLRQRNQPLWAKGSPEASEVRSIGRNGTGIEAYTRWFADPDPTIVANAVICLIHQANYLLDHQIAGLEKQFIQEGGYSERLSAARIEHRSKREPSPETPACPKCGEPMFLRTARKGRHPGSQFWGCPKFPACKGTREYSSDRSVGSD